MSIIFLLIIKEHPEGVNKNSGVSNFDSFSFKPLLKPKPKNEPHFRRCSLYFFENTKEDRLVAVLVINYNGKHHLAECFDSLRKQDYGSFEVYLVDNGSVDGSVNFTQEKFPWVKIIAFNKNYGFAKAYNQAVKQTNVELVAFLNNDTKADKRWLSEVVSCITYADKVVAAGSKMLFYDNPLILNHAGTKITQIGGGYSMGAFEEDNPQKNGLEFVGAVCAGAMLVKRNPFLEVGGFDDDFFAYFEDVDLCWRFWLSGYKVVYCPKSIIYHKHGASFGKKSFFKSFLGVRNRVTTILKNYELNNAFKGFVISLLYDTFRVFFTLSKRKDPVLAKAIFKGYVAVLLDLKRIFVKRRHIQRNRILSDKDLLDFQVIATLPESLKEYFKLNKS